MAEDSHDEWYTQKKDFDVWRVIYGVNPKLDVSASKQSHMCKAYFTKEDDALTKTWSDDFFMNPPLLGGLTKKFTLYAVEQAFENEVNGLCVIPAGVIARQWFRPIWRRFVSELENMDSRFEKPSVLIDPIKRPSFHDHGAPIGQQARNDYIMLVLRGRS